MATNQKAVITNVRQVPDTNFIDINRTVALISDTATFADIWKLYTDLDSVEVDFASTEETYKMAAQYFAGTGGSGYFYVVPVRTGIAPAYDVINTLTILENDPALTFAMVTADLTIREATEILDGSLATAKYDKPYHMAFETDDVSVITATTTDPIAVNGAIYDGLTGEASTVIGNMSFIYITTASDYQASYVCGKLMSQNIGSQTAKFIKPSASTPITLTGAELAFILGKNGNVYTGTGEDAGRAFMKEGVSVKEGSFIDTSLGAIWMDTQITSVCYDLFLSQKVSIDTTGFALLENATKPVFKLAQTNGIVQTGENKFSISFSAGTGREIIGTYSYFEAVAGHFVTNTVNIK